MPDSRYWSVEHCAWVTPGVTDPLATPWSDADLAVPAQVWPHDAADLLHSRGSTVPDPRPGARRPAPR